MRYYLINQDNDEHLITLHRTKIHGPELVEFDYSISGSEQVKIYIRRLARSYYASTDGISWEKLARQDLPDRFLNVDQIYSFYRGYKPSGLSSGGEGELHTQMPGKVVKILVEPGAKIEKGQTLLILEAMKMENEIKSSLDGEVKAIHVKEGEALEQGVLMLEIE